MVACHKSDDPQVVPAPSAVAAASSSAPSKPPVAIAPDKLPVCGLDAGAEPLAVLCDVGKEASLAHFECKAPQPIAFCGAVDTWGCTTNAFAGEKPAPIAFEARVTHSGAPMPMNVPMETKDIIARNPRKGPLRGVAVHYRVGDDAEGKRKLAEVNATIVSWGCADAGKHSLGERYDCGTWTIDTHYLDITKIVYVEGGTSDAFECK